MPTESSIDRERDRRRAAEQELVESYAALQTAHEELKASQKSLVQSEKLASLGILSAGVAHEINNPVGYIVSNVSTLADYLPDLVDAYSQCAALLEEIEPNHPLYEKKVALQSHLKSKEIGYLLEDTEALVGETLEGARCVLEIVQGLKNFARTDEGVTEAADINDVLKSTLSLVNNELKYHCNVYTEFGELPSLECSPGKLGQVFMNILINAGHAIENKGNIHISSEYSDGFIQVCIRDDGCGMDESVAAQIFQPFFTTKGKSKGTGLGLAISYGIVEEHSGSIEVNSRPGEGTRFTVLLPVRH